MASQINASNSGFGGVVTSGDSSGILQLQTASTTAVTIDTSQNVGIGTTSPTGISAGYPTLDIKGASGSGLRLGSATYQSYAYTDAAGMTLGTATGQSLNFFTNGTQKATIDSSGNLLFNSGYGSAALAYGCRAWANFNGTSASPITPRAAGNVTSITKGATGLYTINLTNALVDANYAVVAMATQDSGGTGVFGMLQAGTTPSTSSFILLFKNTAGTNVDEPYVYVAVFR